MIPLPIDPHLPDIVSALQDSGVLILTAPPGAGKTTRIPRALLDAAPAGEGEILVLEPRRLAARLAAARVAEELGEKPGRTVGYTIRFDTVAGPETRIRFLTEAILTRRIVQDPGLKGVSAVILDEFHERHLATDLALALLKSLRLRRPELRLLVMSATMETAALAAFLPGARVLSAGERPFGVDIRYEEKADGRPLSEKVATAVRRLLGSGPRGDILVFLPGAAEIRRAAGSLAPAAASLGASLHVLHGDMTVAEQRRVLEPAADRKVILATNVAETSITVPGIAAVIDSGLARVAGHSAWSGFSTLSTAKISRGAAAQRAGRAGRTQDGCVLRLYTRQDFESRPEQEAPEIRRVDLAETALLLHGAGIRDLRSFGWFEPPPASAVEAAESLLRTLGALSGDGRLTGPGRRMLRLGVHPRLARMALEGEARNCPDESALLAALVSERDIRLDARAGISGAHPRRRSPAAGDSDLLELLDRFREAEAAGFEPGRVHGLGLDAAAVGSVRRSWKQLRRLLAPSRVPAAAAADAAQTDEGLRIAALAAFPDRVAKRRRPASRELLLAGGGMALLSPSSVVHDAAFLVAVDAEERKERGAPRLSHPKIRLASAIEVEWLVDLFAETVQEQTRLAWNAGAARVEEVRTTSYGQISLEEIVRTAPPSGEAALLLADAALRQGLSAFRDAPGLPALRARLRLLAKHFPGENFAAPDDDALLSVVARACIGRRSLSELNSVSLLRAFQETLTERQRAILACEAPERVALRSGRTVRIHYESAAEPWIESRLQDFFGTRATPRICAGRVPLTVHLLAPNGRAVQVTRDLAGFWPNHYPAIRRELRRRYPKHAWPEPGTWEKTK